MKAGFRFVFVIFFVTAVLIFAVYLRNAADHTFYRICTDNVAQNRVRQKLWQKQLQLESLINPAALSQRLDKKP